MGVVLIKWACPVKFSRNSIIMLECNPPFNFLPMPLRVCYYTIYFYKVSIIYTIVQLLTTWF